MARIRTVTLEELDPRPAIDFVLVTAVPVEREAMLKYLRPLSGQSAICKLPWHETTYFLGECGNYRCALLLCEPGSGGPSGSTVAVIDAIDRWSPRGVILVGIAFGKDPAKQQIGDVLVSKFVIPYELQRIGSGAPIFRSPQPPASIIFLDRVRNLPWKGKSLDGVARPAELGGILSGEKLVDNHEFKRALFDPHPAAIGGEMEGAGLYAAAARRRIDWIIIKAICDWGEGKTDTHHKVAARNAATFVRALLAEGTLDAGHFGRGSIRPESAAEREMRAATRELHFSRIQSEIRSNNERQAHTSKMLMQYVQENELSGSLVDPELPRELMPKVEELAADNDRAVERWLTAYNDGCASYLAGAVDPNLFRVTFGQEIRSLFEDEGDHSKRLFPREQSHFTALWDVYLELKDMSW